MNTFFGYVRVSTQRQGQLGSSLEEQRAAIERYAERERLRITGWFEERETAAKAGRTQFNQMLADIERGRASGLIIHKIDRSARNLKDWARLGELIDHGYEVRFAHETLDMHSRGGRLAADIQAVVAADYIRNLRDEVKKGFYGRLKAGLYPLRPPAGYRPTGKGRRHEVCPVKAPLVQLAFEQYATGEHSLDTLRALLHEKGLGTSSGKMLSREALARILHNPFYIGIMRIRATGETFPGVHEPLISGALHDAVQARLSGKAVRGPKTHHHLLSRMIMCAGCGRYLVGEVQKSRTYYRCHGRSCRGTCVSEQSLVIQLQAYLAQFVLTPEEIRDLRDVLEEDRANSATRAQAHAQTLRLATAKVDERLSRLTDALLDQVVDRETFIAKKEALVRERVALKEENLHSEEGRRGADIEQALELANIALRGGDTLTRAEIVQLAKTLRSNFLVSQKTLQLGRGIGIAA